MPRCSRGLNTTLSFVRRRVVSYPTPSALTLITPGGASRSEGRSRLDRPARLRVGPTRCPQVVGEGGTDFADREDRGDPLQSGHATACCTSGRQPWPTGESPLAGPVPADHT